MNAGLVWLLRRAPRAWVRSLARRAQGPKRVLLVLGTAFVLLVIAAGQIPAWRAASVDPEAVAERLRTARLLTPLVLTAFVLLIDVSGRGLYFRPAEIDFLFPAPVPRRDLLLYQIASRSGMAALSGLWTSIFVARWAGTVVGGVVTAVLAIVFLQFTSQLVSLAVAALGERAAPRVRAAVWIGGGVLLAIGARSALTSIPEGASTKDTLLAFAESPFVFAVTLPTQPFAQLFAAESSGAVALWGAACVAEMALMLAIILRLDVGYEEAALASSRKIQERLRRMRSGEGAFLPSAKGARRRKVPALPRLGGAGPVARRQLIEVVRNPASILWTTGSMVFCAVLIVTIGDRDEPAKLQGTSLAAAGAAIALTTFANQGFTFDFRRDLDRMAEMKLLPLRAVTIAAGQLVAPTLVFTLVQGCAFAVVFAVGSLPWWASLVAVAALPPWNWLSAALDNAFFLLFPYRIAPEDTARVPFIGKMLLTMVLKSFAVGIVAVGVGVPVGVGVAVGGAAIWAGAAIGWCVLAGAAVASTWLVAGAFRAYDVSRDI